MKQCCMGQGKERKRHKEISFSNRRMMMMITTDADSRQSSPKSHYNIQIGSSSHPTTKATPYTWYFFAFSFVIV